jgi:tRNA threonylcarbamoyladenosine biosynthesis protein TsaE
LEGRFITRSERETLELGEKFALELKDGDIVELNGRLGAGKTVFTKGIASGLGITEDVTSPTFTILKEYSGRLKLNHFDLYRIDDEEELKGIGFYDYLGAEGVCVIEWAEKAPPPERISVNIEVTGDDERTIEILTAGEEI